MGINKDILIKAEWRFCFQCYASKMGGAGVKEL